MRNGSPKKKRVFQEDLAWSKEQAKLPLWEETYRRAFPDFAGMSYVPDDGPAQRGGVDRIVTTRSGRVWLIDEKSRRDYWESKHKKYFKSGATVFPDIALEYLDHVGRGTKGWIEKPMSCDYLAYNILPIYQVYLLPMAQMQAAWKIWKLKWIEEFEWRDSLNDGYETRFCPVPVPVLMRAVCEAMFFRHTKLAEYEQHIKRAADVPFDALPERLDTLFDL